MSKKKYNDIPVAKEVANEVVETDLEKKTLEKVVSVQPRKVKKSLINRLVSGIVGPDGASGIGEYVNEEIIKPAIKNIIVDAVNSGINMLMYGDRGGVHHRGRNYGSGYRRDYQNSNQRTNYTSRYTQHNPEPTRSGNDRGRRTIEEYLIEDRFEAASVLTTLTEAADTYGHVSVADYYDLIGVEQAFTDHSYGWTFDSIVRATVISVRGGYVIKFPPLEVI